MSDDVQKGIVMRVLATFPEAYRAVRDALVRAEEGPEWQPVAVLAGADDP